MSQSTMSCIATLMTQWSVDLLNPARHDRSSTQVEPFIVDILHVKPDAPAEGGESEATGRPYVHL